MRFRMFGTVVALGLTVLTSGTASACHRCRQTPCVIAPPAPRVECVTDMVPYTVMKTRTRTDYQPVTETVMTRVPETTFTERQRVVCKPVFDTTTVQKRIVVRKPVFDTEYVTQNVTTCRPVSETHQVTEICMQPSTTYVTVPVTMKVKSGHCGSCGKSEVICGCETVAQTCYTPVPVVRDVTTTRMVRETSTRQVPVTHCRMVCEEKLIEVPVTHCRMVQEVVTDKVPHTTWHCEPKQVTRMVPVPVCETVPVTCYRPVTRMVTIEPPVMAAAQYSAAPSGQAAASGQN